MALRNILIVGLLLACTSLRSLAAETATQPQNTQQDAVLLKLIPDPLPPQAVAQGPAAFYVPDNLYQYMDGGADIFLIYDVQKLLHQDFKVKEVDITVDIFDMGTPEKAFGIYASERAPFYPFIAIGTEGYQNEGILNFLQGCYYVKLAAFGAGSGSVLEQFAQGISAKIGDKGAFPTLVQQLPQSHLKLHSEQFMPKDPLGHPFLAPAYVAIYSLENQESMLLVSVAANEAEAQQRLQQLDKHFRDTGKSEAAPELGEGAIRASNSFEGKLIARTKDRYLVLLFNPVTGAPEILKEAVDRLK